MAELSAALAHSHACIATAQQLRALFDVGSTSTEKVAAHALFCRCIDHFRAALLLAQNGLDAEALTLVRGICETTFVLCALLKGVLTTSELEAFDRAGKAKGAKALDDFLQRMAPPDLQDRLREFAEQNAGPVLKFEQLARQVGSLDLYNGHYRHLSHFAAHPSVASVEKYLDYGDQETRVVYPGVGRRSQATVLISSAIFMHACAALEHWLGTTPEVNRAVRARLEEHEAFGPMHAW